MKSLEYPFERERGFQSRKFSNAINLLSECFYLVKSLILNMPFQTKMPNPKRYHITYNDGGKKTTDCHTEEAKIEN